MTTTPEYSVQARGETVGVYVRGSSSHVDLVVRRLQATNIPIAYCSRGHFPIGNEVFDWRVLLYWRAKEAGHVERMLDEEFLYREAALKSESSTATARTNAEEPSAKNGKVETLQLGPSVQERKGILYVLVNGTEAKATQLYDHLASSGVSVRRLGKSFLKAPDGKMYDWYISLNESTVRITQVNEALQYVLRTGGPLKASKSKKPTSVSEATPVPPTAAKEHYLTQELEKERVKSKGFEEEIRELKEQIRKHSDQLREANSPKRTPTRKIEPAPAEVERTRKLENEISWITQERDRAEADATVLRKLLAQKESELHDYVETFDKEIKQRDQASEALAAAQFAADKKRARSERFLNSAAGLQHQLEFEAVFPRLRFTDEFQDVWQGYADPSDLWALLREIQFKLDQGQAVETDRHILNHNNKSLWNLDGVKFSECRHVHTGIDDHGRVYFWRIGRSKPAIYRVHVSRKEEQEREKTRVRNLVLSDSKAT